MNYIDIKEAVQLTGKSDKTIRRFIAKNDSKPYINKKDGKTFVEVNYLLSSFSAINTPIKETRQSLDIDRDLSMDKELLDLKNKLALSEQELKHKDMLLAEREGRIIDLQKAMLLLEAPKDLGEKKKSWWRF